MLLSNDESFKVLGFILSYKESLDDNYIKNIY